MTRAEELELIDEAIAAGKLRRCAPLEISEATRRLGAGIPLRDRMAAGDQWPPLSFADCDDLPSW